MKIELLPAGETALDRQLRETLASMALACNLPSDAWKRFDAKLKQMAEKPLETEAR